MVISLGNAVAVLTKDDDDDDDDGTTIASILLYRLDNPVPRRSYDTRQISFNGIPVLFHCIRLL